VPSCDNAVHVTVTGGTLLALDNADMRYHGRYQVDSLAALNGRGLAIIRPAGAEPLSVVATAIGLTPGRLLIPVRVVVPPTAVPPAR